MVQTKNKTITIPINDAIEADLAKFAAEQNRDPIQVVRELIVEWLEDQADIQAAERALAEEGPTYSLAEMRERLALDD